MHVEARRKLLALNEDEVRIAELERQLEQSTTSYQTYMTNLEQARIDEELETDRITNISVAQAPSLVPEPLGRGSLTILLLGLVVATFGSIGSAYLAEYLDVRVRGNELQVAMKRSHSYSPSDDGMRAVISMPELTGLDLSGASEATLSGFSSQKDLSIDLSGASELKGQITAANVAFDLSGASEMSLKGTGQHGKLDLSGASQAALFEFQLQSAQANLSGASKAKVHVVKRLDISASGASDLIYAGEPEMGMVSTSGASSVSKR